MGIKVHGNPMSAATLRVVAAVHEKQLDHEFVTVDMKSGAHKQPPNLLLFMCLCSCPTVQKEKQLKLMIHKKNYGSSSVYLISSSIGEPPPRLYLPTF